MANICKKVISILAGNLNLGRSYLYYNCTNHILNFVQSEGSIKLKISTSGLVVIWFVCLEIWQITSAHSEKWNAPSELVQPIFLYSMCKNKGVTTNEHSIQQISMSNLFDFCTNFPCFANSVPRTLCNWTPTTPPHRKSARLLCSIQCIQILKV